MSLVESMVILSAPIYTSPLLHPYMTLNKSRSSKPAAAVSRDAWWTILILGILYVLSFADRQVISMLVSPIKADLHLSDFQMSLLMGISFALIYGISGLPMGYLADRISRRLLIFVGVIVWASSACACGFAQSFPWLLVARSGVGIGEATLPASANSLISEKVPRERLAFSLSLFAMATAIGDGLSFLLSGVVLGTVASGHAQHWPLLGAMRTWQWVFLLSGIPGLLLAPLVFTFREPRTAARRAETAPAQPYGGSFVRWMKLHARLVMCFAGCFCVLGIVGYAISQWTPAYMGRAFHWTPMQFGVALGLVFPVASVIGHLVCGRWVDSLFERGETDACLTFTFRSIIIGAPFVIGGYLIPSPWACLLGIVVAKAILTPFLGYSMAGLMAAVPPRLRARASATYMFALTLLGGMVGPSIIAGITDFGFRDEAKLGYSLAMVISACLGVALLCARLGRPALREAVFETQPPAAG
jgi:MFS family permease